MLHNIHSLFFLPGLEISTAQSHVAQALQQAQHGVAWELDLIGDAYRMVREKERRLSAVSEWDKATYGVRSNSVFNPKPKTYFGKNPDGRDRLAAIVREMPPERWKRMMGEIRPKLEEAQRILQSVQPALSSPSNGFHGYPKIFLGVPFSGSLTPQRAAEAIGRSAHCGLGADFLALGAAYSLVAPEEGFEFQILLAQYLADFTKFRLEGTCNWLAQIVGWIPAAHWDAILSHVQKAQWPLAGGILATPRTLLLQERMRPLGGVWIQSSANLSRNPVIVTSMEELEVEIETLLKNSQHPQRVAHLVFPGRWPANVSIDIDEDLLRKAAQALGQGTPLAMIDLPEEAFSVGVVVEQNRWGRWVLRFQVIPEDDSVDGGFLRNRYRLYLPTPDRQEALADRKEADRRLLESGNPRSQNFRRRMESKPVLQKWLDLEDPAPPLDYFMVSPPKMLNQLGHLRAEYWNTLWNHLISLKRSPQATRKMKQVFNPFFGSLDAITESQWLQAHQLFREWQKEGFWDEDHYLRCRNSLVRMASLTRDIFDYREGGGNITCKIAFVSRDMRVDSNFPNPHPFGEDLSIKFLGVFLPNGELAGGFYLRLFQSFSGALGLVHDPVSLGKMDDWMPEELIRQLGETGVAIGASLGIPVERIESSFSIFARNWGQGYSPVTDPPEADAVLKNLLQGYNRRLPGALGANAELLRPLPKGLWAAVTWWRELPLPVSGEDFFLREIDPDPVVGLAGSYLAGFSAQTGRSVSVPIDWEGPDGTRWHYLDMIGAGKTLRARSGAETRDGVLPFWGALRRFFFTNFMHQAAGPLGFRTSLGVAVVDKCRVRKEGQTVLGMPQGEGISWELRREQMRLSDLVNNGESRELIDFVKGKVAQELGRESLTDDEYVAWLAGTLGEQLAIMGYFGFDHGIYEGAAQLHPGNVSPLGEVFDNDTARILKNRRKAAQRYLDNKVVPEEGHLDLRHIRAIQKALQKGVEMPDNWLSVLHKLAPGVDFYAILLKAKRAKVRELKKSGVDPVNEMRRFVKEYWNVEIRPQLREIFNPRGSRAEPLQGS